MGVYVRDDFTVEILATSKPLSQKQPQNKPEFLILQVSTTHTKILFAAIYRRPPADYPHDFLSCLSTYLSHFSSVIITGDLNINMANPTAPNSAKLTSIATPCTSFHLHPLIINYGTILIRGSTSTSLKIHIQYPVTPNPPHPS